ncbi:hypothetical protein QA612_08370 [Evansella sp. AB-P1]|uniref:hypothetical protein n=1 Tax=Evansella sp. AB-P1 TaxID=3037653 RepID=UPI00241C1AC3|nr:hypothetical protein [Evansella sp. AB-P1]MDG5787508.1 hypothetical protein [Evansella sp. AB-P1]
MDYLIILLLLVVGIILIKIVGKVLKFVIGVGLLVVIIYLITNHLDILSGFF